MGVVRKIADAVLAVPVFVKVMGIALSLIVLFGTGTIWQLRVTERRIEQAEHGGATGPVLEQHLAQETAVLTKDLTRVMAFLSIIGLLLAWGLTRILVHPLQELVYGVRAVQKGDYRTRVPVRARDETGDLATAFNDMASALDEKEAARQRLLRKLMQVGEEERKRLARELHDQTGQLLTALIAGLSALEARATDPGQRASLVSLHELAAQTLGDIHNVSRALRPAALDDLGLLPALEKHCGTVTERFGKPVAFHHDGWENGARLPSEIEIALYRIVQEALTNAIRHADATRIQVLLQRKTAAVIIAVRDNGRGFNAGERHANGDKLGLLGIEERAAMLGGHACLESAPGNGTQLVVQIPAPAP